MRIKCLFVAFVAVFAMSSSAMPASQNTPSMAIGNVTSQPIGHYDFCQRYRSECGPVRDLKAVDLNADTWALVTKVNLSVNRMITPATDKEVYGVEEFWAYPTTAGDCEDFALLKRRILIQRGISPSNLLMTVVRKPDGEGHAVLTLRTSQGDLYPRQSRERGEALDGDALFLHQAPGEQQCRPLGHHRERPRRSGRRFEIS